MKRKPTYLLIQLSDTVDPQFVEKMRQGVAAEYFPNVKATNIAFSDGMGHIVTVDALEDVPLDGCSVCKTEYVTRRVRGTPRTICRCSPDWRD